MTSLVLTVKETLRYRGAIGQWSWVLHRVSGLGVLLFLVLHVIDTSWAVFYPDLYEKAIAVYQTPLFTIGEFVLVACVVYHAFNGLRISVFDFKPQWWAHQQRAAWGVIVATVLVLVPVFIGMMSHVVKFHSDEPNILPLSQVIESQLPFAVGIAAAVIAAVLLSGLYGMVAGSGGGQGALARTERFWWSFMRLSGILIVPLVFAHLAAMHILQGVFDITAAGYAVVGTQQVGPALTDGTWIVPNGWNDTGTAVEFVAERWNYLVGGIAIWRLVDIALLALVTVHGFNGLRYVLTDYLSDNELLRRASVYLCVIGAVVLLVVGGLALLGTIDDTAIAMAVEAAEKLYGPAG